MSEPTADSSYTILSFTGKDVPPQYHSVILSNWLRTLRFGNPVFKQIDSFVFYKHYEFNLKRKLRDGSCIVRLAVLTEDNDVVLGFSVHHKNVLDYISVKKNMRRNGIARALLPQGIEKFTHFTKTGALIWQEKFKNWKFDPFA
jgi:hypothetical protein